MKKVKNSSANNTARQANKNEQAREQIRILRSMKNVYGGRRTRKASRKNRRSRKAGRL